jgi:hypothetical protein
MVKQHGWVAVPEEIVNASLNAGFEECALRRSSALTRSNSPRKAWRPSAPSPMARPSPAGARARQRAAPMLSPDRRGHSRGRRDHPGRGVARGHFLRRRGRLVPPGFCRQLPKLAEGALEGSPPVVGLAWAVVAHTDSRFEPEILRLVVWRMAGRLTKGEQT